MMIIEVYGESRKGEDHKENEDGLLINKDKNLFAVADGLTLPYGGKEASSRAIQYLDQFFTGDLEKAFEKTNEKINEDKLKIPSVGWTTLNAAYVKNDGIVEVANVGDSFAYLIEDEIKILLAPSLTYVIGQPKIVIDVWRRKIKQDELILLCTDGITGVAKENDIFDIVKNNSIKNAVIKLLDYAEKQPTVYKDDKTAILLKLIK